MKKRCNLAETDELSEFAEKLHVTDASVLVGQDLAFLIGLAFTDVKDADLMRLKRRDPVQILDGRLDAVGHQDWKRRRRLRRRSFLPHARHRRVIKLQEHETGVSARHLRRLGRLRRPARVMVI